MNTRPLCGAEGCKTKVKIKEDKNIKCEKCKNYFHVACSGFDEKAYDFLYDTQAFAELIWCCAGCRPTVRKIIGIIDTIDDKLKQVDKTIDEFTHKIGDKLDKMEEKFTNVTTLENRLKMMEKEINKKDDEMLNAVENKIEGVKRGFEQENTNTKQNIERMRTIEEKITMQEEYKDKERRRNNIILYNIPESRASDAKGQITEDCQKLKDIFARNNFTFTQEHFINIYRLGPKHASTKDKKEREGLINKQQENEDQNQKNENEDKQKENDDQIQKNENEDKQMKENYSKPRPLLLKFKTFEFKKMVLDHCKELKYLNTETQTSTPIYWGMDLTIKERDERRKLVEEMKIRKSNGENDIAIRNGRIVTILKRFPRGAQQKPCWADIFK